MSDWELTETYSPAAIDMAPATSPAMPATRTCEFGAAVRRHPDDQARGRDDPVIGSQHGGAQPADARHKMVFDMQPAHAFRIVPSSFVAAATVLEIVPYLRTFL